MAFCKKCHYPDFGDLLECRGTLSFSFDLSHVLYIISDTWEASHMANDISSKILARIYGKGRGYVFTPKDFLDLANHATVRQSLTRFVDAGITRRLLRGVYDYPAFSEFLKAPASPDPDAIARAIARTHGWTLQPAGETALNILGLSTQVPAQWQYFSDGPSKKYEWSGPRGR
jgi:hypothetical protein